MDVKRYHHTSYIHIYQTKLFAIIFSIDTTNNGPHDGSHVPTHSAENFIGESLGDGESEHYSNGPIDLNSSMSDNLEPDRFSLIQINNKIMKTKKV